MLTAKVSVVVTRKQRVIDTIFTASVAILVSLIYINFGCAVNWGEFKQILQKPIGPAIGFCGQFILMPLVSTKSFSTYSNNVYLYLYATFEYAE